MSATTTPSPIPAEIVAMLRDLGLSSSEVRAYKFLLRVGTAGCSAIARETGQPRGRIYESMRDLAAKGFVQEESSRPIRFRPTPTNEVLAAAKQRFARHLEAIRENEKRLAATPPTADEAHARPVRTRDVRVLAGRRPCMAEVARMANQSTRSFWLMGGGRFAERLSNMPRLQETLRSKVRAGVDVRLLLAGTELDTPSMVWLRMSFAAQIHALGPDQVPASVVTCVNESSAIDILVQPDDDAPNRGDDVGIRVFSPGFAAAARLRIDSCANLPRHPEDPAEEQEENSTRAAETRPVERPMTVYAGPVALGYP